jgi:hypothetical protein
MIVSPPQSSGTSSCFESSCLMRSGTSFPWLTREYAYPHASVRLNFYRVTAW